MNHLSSETSPYLLQHADNPVEWHPWGPEALELAKRRNKPILLSIGYSACHWCHVMAHESFEDADTAKLMNEQFVNIKVDREERPDLDRIYQVAHQMLAQRSGGWPLTMFLSPEDQRPFFSGTYFPPAPRQGMPAFREILERVAAYYRQHPEEIRQQNAALDEAFTGLTPPPSREALNADPLRQVRAIFQDEFDSHYGGFGEAPKFPHPPAIERLLRQWHASAHLPKPDLHALYMATLTLRRMGEGGLFDQVGGGFCRYSVDRYWMIPHFEKMLYDNGQLLAVYAQAASATGDAFYARTARATADWALREMQAPTGGFYSSFDADSEGEEGRFYIWNKPEVEALLTPEEYRIFARYYGLDRAPNFQDPHTGSSGWHLHAHESLEQLATTEKLAAQELQTLLDNAREKLFVARSKRVPPGRDDKILTAWNALMIRGLAIAARTLREPKYAESATRALEFIRSTLWRDGRLLATAKDGRARLAAYLDDYVFLADAVLELQQCRWRSDEFAFAVELMEVVFKHFGDAPTEEASGGFYFTADDHEVLMHRWRAFGDDATPSGNAIAAQVFNRLGTLLGEPRYLQAAQRTLQAAWAPLQRYPQGHASMITALDEYLHPPETIIIRGGSEAQSWQQNLSSMYAPRRMSFAIPNDATGLPAALGNKAPADKQAGAQTQAYVCRGSTCLPPVSSFQELTTTLRSA
jgi:uncharacterized protein YyaL (SSP411 family)